MMSVTEVHTVIVVMSVTVVYTLTVVRDCQ